VLINEVVGEMMCRTALRFVEEKTYVQACLVGISTNSRCKFW
jgi:hypothetical protein